MVPELGDSPTHTLAELLFLRSGHEPPWTRVVHDGIDVTDHPRMWTDSDWAMRREYEERLAFYRSSGWL